MLSAKALVLMRRAARLLLGLLAFVLPVAHTDSARCSRFDVWSHQLWKRHEKLMGELLPPCTPGEASEQP